MRGHGYFGYLGHPRRQGLFSHFAPIWSPSMVACRNFVPALGAQNDMAGALPLCHFAHTCPSATRHVATLMLSARLALNRGHGLCSHLVFLFRVLAITGTAEVQSPHCLDLSLQDGTGYVANFPTCGRAGCHVFCSLPAYFAVVTAFETSKTARGIYYLYILFSRFGTTPPLGPLAW